MSKVVWDIVPYFEYYDEVRGVKDGVENRTRHIAQAIVKDLSTDKYLSLKWKIDNSVSFVAGWVEEWEAVVDSMIREIHEETGYTDVKYIKHLGKYQAYFYHPLKWHNQHSFGEVLYFVLWSHEHDLLEPAELEKHEPLRMTKDEFLVISNEPVNDYFIWVLENNIPVHRVRVKSSNNKISKKALFFHGRGNTNDDCSCLSWLQKTMYDLWYAIEYTTHDYEKTLAVNIYSPDAHASVVVWHSTGGYLALKYAENHSVDTLIIIAPGISRTHMPEYFKKMATRDFGEIWFTTYQEFHKADIQHENVKSNCRRIIFVFGTNDRIIKDGIVEYYNNIYADKAEIIMLNRGHMWSLEEWADNIPEINKLILD